MLLRELATAAAQAAGVLDGGDTAAALAAADALCAAATQARRLVKAAATGRKPRGTAGPAARPGQLRDLVAAHLARHPDTDFSPHQIGRVLGRSSGAVANALDRLTALGQAELTSEKPRRYRHQAPAGTPAPAPGTTYRPPGCPGRGAALARRPGQQPAPPEPRPERTAAMPARTIRPAAPRAAPPVVAAVIAGVLAVSRTLPGAVTRRPWPQLSMRQRPGPGLRSAGQPGCPVNW